MTKQFAVFMLLPLLLFLIYHSRPKNFKRLFQQLVAFTLPAVCSSLLWYQLIMGKDILYLFHHNDFKDYNFPNVVSNYFFVPRFLAEYGLGILFCAVVSSFLLGLLFWRFLPKSVVVSDLVCLATLGFIVGLELFMAVNLNLKAPYTSAIKYLYQALPFFSLAAASLAAKATSLFRSAESVPKIQRKLLLAVGVAALILLVAPIAANMYADLQLATTPYFVLRVQPTLDVGYSFYVDSPLTQGTTLQYVQMLGFLLVLLGLIWASLVALKGQTCRYSLPP